MSTHKINVLLVDDHTAIRTALKLIIEIKGAGKYNIQEAENGKIGLEIAQKSVPDVVIIDLMMPEMDGFELSTKLKKINPNIKIIIMTAKTDDETINKINSVIQPQAYLSKPVDNDVIFQTVETVSTKG